MPRFDCLLLALLLASAPRADELTIASWGGAYAAAQRQAVIDPFAAQTGTDIDMVHYAGTVAEIVRRAGEEGWDVIDMLADQARVACDAGLLLPIDAEALLGPDALADFAPMKPTECAIPQNVYARVLAFDDRAFPGVKPGRVEHFFDTERFPGPRAVQRSPDGILEWAMLAEGVPPEQVYGLLSTDRGLQLAMRRLDTIRQDIVWWTDPAEPAEMLADGRAVMAAGFNGRFFDLAEEARAPVNIVWDGRIIGTEVWAILATTEQPELARAFLVHATRPDTMARLSELIPYGPARRSAFDRIGLNPGTGAPMRVHLPNAPGHESRWLLRDDAWYANTENLRHRRFREWLDQTSD